MAVTIKKVIGTVAYMGGVQFVPELFCYSLAEMIQYNNEVIVGDDNQIYYDRVQSSYHANARNNIVERMKGDWVLMLDTDHSFDPDLLARMLALIDLADFDIPVLTAMYQFKKHPYSPTVYNYNKKKGINEIISWWEEGARIFPVEGGGAGCLLVQRWVFDRIKSELKQNPFDITHPNSEDISFFKRCKKLGIKVYCAPQIEAYHLSMKPISLEDRDVESLKLGKKYQAGDR